MAPVEGVVGVAGSGTALDHLVGNGRDESRLRGAAQRAGELVAEVAAEGAAVVARRLQAVVYLARRRIPIGTRGFIFITRELLLTMTVGVEVAAVLGVAVTQAGGAETLSVVVDNHRAEDYLVAAVPVGVGNLEVVEAVAKPGVAPSGVVVPAPALRQLMGDGVHVEGAHLVAGIAAAAEEDAGLAAVEEGCAEVVLRRAVARVGLAPGGGIVGLALLEAGQRVGHRRPVVGAVPGVGLARRAVQIEQVLGSLVGVLVARGVVVHVAYLDVLARGGVDNHVVGAAHHALGLAVLVPVEGHEVPLLVGTGHHVRAEVNPPQSLTLHVVALVEIEVGLVVGGIEVAAGVVALDDELHHAVAVDIAERDVVNLVLRRHVSAVAVGHALDGYVLVLGAPACHLGTFLLLHAAHNGSHLVLRRGLAARVVVVRDLQRLGVHLHTVAVEVILRVVVLLAENLPADEVAARSAGHGHESTIQFIGDALGSGTESHQPHKGHKHYSFHLHWLLVSILFRLQRYEKGVKQSHNFLFFLLHFLAGAC